MFVTKYRRQLMTVKKEGRNILDNIEKIAKRSKFITVAYRHDFYNYFNIQLEVNGKSKVVEELFKYIKTLCPFDGTDEEKKIFYFSNFDDTMDEDDENPELRLEVYVSIKE